MIYSNINDMEHFYKFKMKKLGRGVSKVGRGAIKTGGKVGKGVIKTGSGFMDKMNPFNQAKDLASSFGLGGGNSTIISYVSLGLVCLILIAVIIFQLKN
jgi:hypothetical protein